MSHASTSGADPYADWDAAYVLGALDPADRRDYERHLAECEACRTAVAEIAGLPGLLGTIPADPAGSRPPSAVPSSAAPPVASLAAAARRSRRRRRVLAGIAAAACVAVGAVVGVQVSDDGAGAPVVAGPTPPPSAAEQRTVRLSPVGGADMRAELVVVPTDWGTKFRWRCHYPPRPGETAPPGGGTYEPPEPIDYALVLVGRDGTRTVAGTWTWSGGVTGELDASSALPVRDLDRVEIVLDEHQEDPLASATL